MKKTISQVAMEEQFRALVNKIQYRHKSVFGDKSLSNFYGLWFSNGVYSLIWRDGIELDTEIIDEVTHAFTSVFNKE